MHGRTYGFVPNQRRPMGPRTNMPRPSGQRIGGAGRGGMDRMQQGAMPNQQVSGVEVMFICGQFMMRSSHISCR